MSTKCKKIHELLCDFSNILAQHDPMKIGSNDPFEYEFEALSILSRFSESMLQIVIDEDNIKLATEIVRQSFKFWFDYDEKNVDHQMIATGLLDVFLSMYSSEKNI